MNYETQGMGKTVRIWHKWEMGGFPRSVILTEDESISKVVLGLGKNFSHFKTWKEEYDYWYDVERFGTE